MITNVVANTGDQNKYLAGRRYNTSKRSMTFGKMCTPGWDSPLSSETKVRWSKQSRALRVINNSNGRNV